LLLGPDPVNVKVINAFYLCQVRPLPPVRRPRHHLWLFRFDRSCLGHQHWRDGQHSHSPLRSRSGESIVFLPCIISGKGPLPPYVFVRLFNIAMSFQHLRFYDGVMVTCSKDRSIAVWDMVSPTEINLRRVLVIYNVLKN